MKKTFLALGSAALLTSCAGVFVSDTQTAAVVTDRPHTIYIEPFSIAGAEYVGHHPGGPGERPIRESLAPAAFSEDLKEELEKLAPARVLRSDEVAVHGWLVQGSIEKVDAGNPTVRHFAPLFLFPPAGRSKIKIHVRVLDLDRVGIAASDKDVDVHSARGHVIYEFDVAGGSRWSSRFGGMEHPAPGAGYADWFDYRNAAERIRTALEVDSHKYGERTSPTIRE